jgi:hypothetical protein
VGLTYSGSIQFSNNFEVKTTQPLDTRLVVDKIEDLTNGSISAPYTGMVVNVAGTSDLYIFTSVGIVESKKISNWTKVSSSGTNVVKELETSELKKLVSPSNGCLLNVDGTSQIYVLVDSENYTDVTSWKKISSSGGGDGSGYKGSIPIYTGTGYDTLEDEDKPSEYIRIPNTDLDEVVEDNTYTISTLNSGDVASIMFKAIKQLQKEVTMLKNSFNYGIVSMTEGNTASSEIVDEIEEDAEEPIWAIDPDYLTEEESCSLVMSTEECVLESVVDGKYSWTVEDSKCYVNDLSFYDISDKTVELEESKQIYLIRAQLNSSDYEIQIDLSDIEDNNPRTIKFSQFLSGREKLPVNIMFIVDRHNFNEDNDDDDMSGYKSYIHVSVTNNDDIYLVDGYLNDDNKTLSKSEIRFDQYYKIDRIWFDDLILTEARLYVKDSTYTNDEVLPSKLDVDDFKYKVTHLAIRSVEKYENLEKYASRFLENELIYCEEEQKLYIKNNNTIISLAGGTNISGGTGMEEKDLINWLLNQKLIVDKGNNEYDLNLDSLESVKFVHTESGKEFTYSTDAYGNLVGKEPQTVVVGGVVSSDKQTDEGVSASNYETYRTFGAVGYFNMDYDKWNVQNTSASSAATPNAKGDRVRFGSWYISTTTQQVYNCSHDFVEIVNSGTDDYPLSNAVLGFMYSNTVNGTTKTNVECFSLDGVVKAGSTYLVRMKKHLDIDDPLTHIAVNEYDKELWYDYDGTKDLYDASNCIGMVMFHKNALSLFQKEDVGNGKLVLINTSDSLCHPSLIDVVVWSGYTSNFKDTTTNNDTWVGSTCVYTRSDNTLVKDMYELDPAKQAYRSLCTCKDASNVRTTKIAADYIPLKNKKISLCNSSETISIDRYTPKASTSEKNVITDKTQPDIDRPNFVMCGFGKNGLTTRTFNWVSIGVYDEYIWFREKGNTTWSEGISSYTKGSANAEITVDTYTRPEISETNANYVYGRITDYFPATNYTYTSHKLIINFTNTLDSNGSKTIEYVVGRALANGQPDEEHISNVQEFTLHDSTWKPFIIHHTDEQGFGWIEYQVWNAAADEIENKITEFVGSHEKTYPVIIETGDMTQNGTRVNEWLDFYNGGYNLWKKYEHMAVVGNNDLAGSSSTSDIHNELGNGDDAGKSNPFYFNVFHCYEVNYLTDDVDFKGYEDKWLSDIIINSPESKNGTGMYIPSTYYFTLGKYLYLMVNSEITVGACTNLYNHSGINIYTGFDTSKPTDDTVYDTNWSIEKWCKSVLDLDENKDKVIVACCHEMPFTVMTTEQLIVEPNESTDKYRGGTNSSKLNVITKGTYLSDKHGYWFGRMLNEYGCKLCIGGHKHTYAITYPIYETDWCSNYEDTTQYASIGCDVTICRKPIDVKLVTSIPIAKLFKFYNDNKLYTYQQKENSTNYDFLETTTDNLPKTPTVYLMMQATGFKLTSNKELPSRFQFFSKVVPITSVTMEGTSVKSSTADPSQQYPMYALVEPFESDGVNKFNIDVYRISNTQTESLVTPTNAFTSDLSSSASTYTTNTKVTALSFTKYPTGSLLSEKLLLNNSVISGSVSVDGNTTTNTQSISDTTSDFYNNYWYVGEEYPTDIHKTDIQRCWGKITDTKTLSVNTYTLTSVKVDDTTTVTPTYKTSNVVFENVEHTMVVE